MLINKLAIEYAATHYFVRETHKTFIQVADLFVKRARIQRFAELDLEAIVRFKEATLKVAQPVTFNGYLRYLRLLGDYAVAGGYLEKNLFRSIKTANPGRKLFRVLGDETIRQALDILEHSDDNPDDAEFWVCVIKTLYYTGMRRRQLTSLNVGDVDLERNTIILSYRGSKTHREWVIPIHADLKPILDQHLDRIRTRLGRPLRPSDPVFNKVLVPSNYRGDPHRPGALLPTTVSDFFKRFKKKTGLHLSTHRFRHTFATNLCNPAEGEPDVLAVRELLGHTTLQTTKEYVHIRTDRMAKILKGLKLN